MMKRVLKSYNDCSRHNLKSQIKNEMMMGSKVPRNKIACALCTKNRLAKLAWQSDSLCKSHNGAFAIAAFDPKIRKYGNHYYKIHNKVIKN